MRSYFAVILFCINCKYTICTVFICLCQKLLFNFCFHFFDVGRVKTGNFLRFVQNNLASLISLKNNLIPTGHNPSFRESRLAKQRNVTLALGLEKLLVFTLIAITNTITI